MSTRIVNQHDEPCERCGEFTVVTRCLSCVAKGGGVNRHCDGCPEFEVDCNGVGMTCPGLPEAPAEPLDDTDYPKVPCPPDSERCESCADKRWKRFACTLTVCDDCGCVVGWDEAATAPTLEAAMEAARHLGPTVSMDSKGIVASVWLPAIQWRKCDTLAEAASWLLALAERGKFCGKCGNEGPPCACPVTRWVCQNGHVQTQNPTGLCGCGELLEEGGGDGR